MRKEANFKSSDGVRTKFNVQVRGGTVTSNSNGIVCILGSDYLIYRIDLKSQREFAGMDLEPGETLWIYCVPQRFRVLTIMKQSDQCDCPGDVDKIVELE
jgi:hypothetical protein